MLIYFFFLSYLNNQTKEIIKKKGKKNPVVHQQSSQQNFTSHSLTLSLYPCISSSGSLYYKKKKSNPQNFTQKTQRKRTKERVLNLSRGKWREDLSFNKFQERRKQEGGLFITRFMCVFCSLCLAMQENRWNLAFCEVGFNVFLSFWIRERSFSSFLSFYARE